MDTGKVVLLTCEDDAARMAARYLAARFPGLAVIVERNASRSLLLRRRLKRLGFVLSADSSPSWRFNACNAGFPEGASPKLSGKRISSRGGPTQAN